MKTFVKFIFKCLSLLTALNNYINKCSIIKSPSYLFDLIVKSVIVFQMDIEFQKYLRISIKL